MCQPMQLEAESSCCQEAAEVTARMQEYMDETGEQITCITQHPGFQSVCKDRYVLDTAYLQYRQQYGNLQANFRQDQ